MGSRPIAEVEESGWRAECREVLVGFAHFLDHRRFEQAAGLFSLDGVWKRHGEVLAGRAAILSTISARPDSQVERHVLSNIHIEGCGQGECVATSYVTVYRSMDGPQLPVDAPQTLSIGEFHDRLIQTEEGWRITHRSASLIFRTGAVS